MTRDYLTVDDINTKGKTVLCRLDLNSPMDPNGSFLMTAGSGATI